MLRASVKVSAAGKTFARSVSTTRLVRNRPESLQAPVTLDSFTPFFQERRPCVLRGLAKEWPAVQRWRELDYLRAVASSAGEAGAMEPFCRLEMGKDYSDPALQVVEAPFLSFVDFLELAREEWEQQQQQQQQEQQQQEEEEEREEPAVVGGGGGKRAGGGKQTPTTPLVYLAQQQLLEVLPELKGDIFPPNHLMDGLGRELLVERERAGDEEARTAQQQQPQYKTRAKGNLHACNAWMGPSGTTSSLHHDPYDNLLVQLVGRKRVLLFHPRLTPFLYQGGVRAAPAAGGGERGAQQHFQIPKAAAAVLSNTSAVDPRAPDASLHPLYLSSAQGEAQEVVLEEGDALYIPIKHWHFCEALPTAPMSFSVNFWWR